jgi:23S rRNA (pseudouridine1915-N3)-methyltransferase
MTKKIRIIAVGKIKDKNLSAIMDEFRKRITPFCDLIVQELKDEGIAKESLRIEGYLDSNAYLLDQAGKMLSSEEFAALLKKSEAQLTFIIGGPEGISPKTKTRSRLISLSEMTFTHEMARLFFIEQIYRACMINNNRAYYHK